MPSVTMASFVLVHIKPFDLVMILLFLPFNKIAFLYFDNSSMLYVGRCSNRRLEVEIVKLAHI